MLTLSRDEIAARLDRGAALAAVRASLVGHARGDAVSELVHFAFPDHNGEAHMKCGFVRGQPVFVVKVATGFYDNPAAGLPSGNGLVLAVSATTGIPVAVLRDEGWLTDLRTGLAGALATRLFWPDGATTLGIVGTGTQARLQLDALRFADPDLSPVIQVWGRSPEAAARFAAEMSEPGQAVTVAASLEALCRESRVIVTTTPARAPLVRDAWVAPGTHITAVGADAPGKCELEPALCARAGVLAADSRRQSVAHGEFSAAVAAELVAADRIVEIGTLLAADAGWRRDPEDVTIADLTGLGAQDAAIAGALLSGCPECRI